MDKQDPAKINPFFGKTHSAESRAKMSASRTGKKASEETKAKMRAARQGSGNSFFGKKHTEEAKILISENRSGKCLGEENPLFGKYTEEFGKKISKTHRERGSLVGEKNPNWRGGRKDWVGRRDQSWQYKEWRASVFQRDKYTCVFCGKKGGDLEADHIKPWRFFPDHRLDVDNGRTLCKPCHAKTFKDIQKFREEYYAKLSAEIGGSDEN